jgi:hypothetical protein
MTRNPEPPLAPEELESLLKIAQLSWRYDVPEEHIETLFQAGYITKSAINPITRPGLRRLAKDFKPATDPPLSPSAIASLRWMAHIGRIENVPWDHIEVLRRAGYITDSLINPLTRRGLRRLDRESKIIRVTMDSAEVGEKKITHPWRFWVAAILACVTGALCVITPIWPEWIEKVFDGGDGPLQWVIIAALLVITATLGLIAADDWRRSRTPSHTAS